MDTPLSRPAPPPPKQASVPIDDHWFQWIAENRLRDCTPASMVETMVAAGMDRMACQVAVAQMDTDPVFKAARKHQELYRKLESVMANQQKLWASDPNYGVVEKRHSVSTDEFMTRYVRGCRPLVLTGVAEDWPAMKRWSPQDLKARFGRFDVDIQAERSADPRYEENKLNHTRRVRLSDFVDKVLAGGPTNDYYMTANNEALRRPEFAPLLDDIGTLPAFCNRAELAARSSFWFGPGGTVTPLHHDSLMLLHTQVVGRKRWRFISPMETPHLYNHARVYSPIDIDHPDLNRFPRFGQVKVLEVIAEPGDTVFLPLCWWHQVAALDVSLSFSYSCLSVPNEYSYVNPEIWNW
jgi:ribosomal protein L16 Arg81 hydroxylase